MANDTQIEHLTAIVSEQLAGRRLDQILAILFSDYSRAKLQQLIKDGFVLVDNKPRKAKDKLIGGEQIEVDIIVTEQQQWLAEDIELNIIYQDEAIIVINKPVGLVVHPAPGNRSGTLVNALLFHFPELNHVPRAGVVHRLDKDTSGVMVIARTLQAQNNIVKQFQARSVKKTYIALVHGEMVAGKTIIADIDRHPTQRTKMAVVKKGKSAITHYLIDKKYQNFTRLKIQIETGRTHQIRVHMQHINHAIVADPVYTGRIKVPSGCSTELVTALANLNRQALHAFELAIQHPVLDTPMSWQCFVADDLQALFELLEKEHNHLNII